ASTVAFVSGIYVTSAIAGSLRGGMATQPITDLAIAFATATTLPWGPWPQLASVTVAVLAIALGDYAVHGTLAGTSPHMAAGLGARAPRHVHPEDLRAVTAAFARAIDGHAASVECRVARRDGSWCDVEAVFTNLLDHPAVGGIVVNWRDIGERKRAEEERA